MAFKRWDLGIYQYLMMKVSWVLLWLESRVPHRLRSLRVRFSICVSIGQQLSIVVKPLCYEREGAYGGCKEYEVEELAHVSRITNKGSCNILQYVNTAVPPPLFYR